MSESYADLPPWLGAAFPFVFVAGWLFVLNLLALIGGWRSLARSYRSAVATQGESFSFRSASLGLVNYGSCLRFVAGQAGLYISVLAPFRPGHKPLFIPWSDISVQPHRGWLFRYVDFQFAQHPRVRLRVFRGLAEKLLAAGGHVVRVPESA